MSATLEKLIRLRPGIVLGALLAIALSGSSGDRALAQEFDGPTPWAPQAIGPPEGLRPFYSPPAPSAPLLTPDAALVGPLGPMPEETGAAGPTSAPLDQALAAPPADFAAVVAPVQEAVVEVVPCEKPPPKLWSGRIQLGLNGSDGNSQQLTARSTGKAKRETLCTKLTLDVVHVMSHADSDLTQDNALFDGRFEKLFADGPWSWFVHETTEFDEFKAFDIRVTADSGLALRLIKDESIELQVRAGAGFSREYGVPAADYVPEASGGFTFEDQLGKQYKLLIKGDIYPDWRAFSDYRAQGEAAWEVKPDPDGGFSIRLSLIDRYDSTPSGKKHNDITYAAELAWDF
jgi:hypothetical protein